MSIVRGREACVVAQIDIAAAVPDRAAPAVPESLLSSRSRRWSGLVVELRRARDIDAVAPCHDHVIAVIVSGGANLYQCRGGQTSHRTLRSGDVIVTPAGDAKHWQHFKEVVWISLRLSPEYVDRVAYQECFLRARRPEIHDNFGTRDSFIEETALRLLRSLESESFASRIYVESLTHELALHLLRHYSTPVCVAEKHRAVTLPPRKMQRAIEYIETNLCNDLTLSEIASTLSMSPGHFSHAFRQAVGFPPHRYVLNRRIERAKSMLRDSDLPISAIANRIGCSSPSSFSALFRRATGTTPRDYRNGD
jgi:AraC family transcriptional regulator